MNLSSTNDPSRGAQASAGSSHVLSLALAWAAVGVPLAWGVAETLRKALALFQ
jgi:hypothetical protein